MARTATVLAALMVSIVPAVAAPSDVAAYMDRRLGCNHWADEDGYDAARRAEIKKAVAKLKCDLLDREEQKLRHRYRHNPEILNQIDKARESYPN